MRYDITHHPERDRWYLDASWSADTPALPSLDPLAASGARLLSVDLNANHLAACVVDACGNSIGQPLTVLTALSGPAAQRDGRLRQVISELIHLAHRHGCAGIAIENLGFADARATGRETKGPRPPAHGTASPPRTAGTPPTGGKTRGDPGDQHALFPAPNTVRGAPGPSPGPAHGDSLISATRPGAVRISPLRSVGHTERRT
ncbi:hypothetical protein ACTWPT_24100 [Nonomuraea sp. 3N208]|uniref:hypothetical protein n=1 Tax=Nonomuraea sp. 3N208 TaxID=3457421 RepID=UPI003FD327E0